MAFAKFDPKLLSRIVEYIAPDHRIEISLYAVHARRNRTRIAKFATISEKWQVAVEHYTFRSLRVNSDDLCYLLEDQSQHRRMSLREISLDILLPHCSDNPNKYLGTESEIQANNKAFTQAINGLFRFLSSLDNISPDPIRLCIGNPSRCDWTYHCIRSQLRLLEPEKLPSLKRIHSVTLSDNMGRLMTPSTIVEILSKLPNLEWAHLKLEEGDHWKSDIRSRSRQEFAGALLSLRLSRLQSLDLWYKYRPPATDLFNGLDVRGDHALPNDSFTAALRGFLLQNTMLTMLTLEGPICLDAGFFWPSKEDDAVIHPTWPNLNELVIYMSSVRPDGGSYFERDRSFSSAGEMESSDSNIESWCVDCQALEDCEGYGEFSRAGEMEPNDEWRVTANTNSTTSTESELERRFFSQDSCWCVHDPRRHECANYRSVPTPELVELLKAAARAVAKMPNLEMFMLTSKVLSQPATGYRHQDFELFFLDQNRDTSEWNFGYCASLMPVVEPEHDGKHRLYWMGPSSWRMDHQLEALWRKIIGAGGIIDYQDWDVEPGSYY